MRKKYHLLLVSLAIFLLIGLFLVWYVFNFFHDKECCDWPSKYNKGIEIILKIEDYRKCKGKLPESIEDIGETCDEGGPIFYEKIDATNYEIWFGTTLGESCTYHSKTKEWTPY